MTEPRLIFRARARCARRSIEAVLRERRPAIVRGGFRDGERRAIAL